MPTQQQMEFLSRKISTGFDSFMTLMESKPNVSVVKEVSKDDERIKKLEEKVDAIAAKLDFIFGKNVLINGRFTELP